MEQKIVDHLFRHHYGKMVAILTQYFGLAHIETIEDAVQDTFIKATLKWRKQIPEYPEAWLTKVAKNRTIDLLRSIKAEKNRNEENLESGFSEEINELFLDHEIEDSQLRMIFVACHPKLKPNEQIAFALKTISGFSTKEIAAALLSKEDTITKRLHRARQSIVKNNLQFEFPAPNEVYERLLSVMHVIYLTFNEGFHSTNSKQLIREDLCGEALRLCKLLLKKEKFRSGSMYALFALLCYHASRLQTKTNTSNEIVAIREQDRSKWFLPLIQMGHSAMNTAMDYDEVSIYHYEAAIAAEHVKATTFENTDWKTILVLYQKLQQLQPSHLHLLNIATVKLQLNKFESVSKILESLAEVDLGQRAYLYYGCYAEYFERRGDTILAIIYLNKAIAKTSNSLEKNYLKKKMEKLQGSNESFKS